MNNTFIITNRLNWIDWAKVIAISFVVFGHIPQVSGSFPQHYIVTFHMPLFFFISGYLTKKELLNANTLKKILADTYHPISPLQFCLFSLLDNQAYNDIFKYCMV